MIKLVIALMVIFNVAWPVCTKISMPTDYSVVTNGSRANLKANFDETQTKVNPCMDSVDEVRARLTGYTGSFGVYSLENLLLRLDTDASTSAKLVVQNSNGDSLYRVAEDSSARVFGAFRADGAVTLSNYTSGQVPYFGTAGLLTSGTGLTYNGSAFSVTGTGAISGNTTVGGTLAVTGSSTLTGGFTANANSNIIGPSAGTKVGLGTASPASLNSRNTVLEVSAANDGTVQLPGIVLRANGTAYSTNPAWEMFLSNPSGTTTGFNIFSGTNNYFNINSSGLVTLPGTLAVTGASTLTGAVTHGAGFIDKTTSLTSNTTLTTAHSVILADASGGAFTITLPTAVGNSGLTYKIIKSSSSSNCVTVATTSSQYIGGYASMGLCGNVYMDRLFVVSNGVDWGVLDLYTAGNFTFTETGMTTSPTGTAIWSMDEYGDVSLEFETVAGTSNSTSFTITGIPASIQTIHASGISVPILLTDNDIETQGTASMTPSSGTMTFSKASISGANIVYSSTGFTASGGKKIGHGRRTTINYKIF